MLSDVSKKIHLLWIWDIKDYLCVCVCVCVCVYLCVFMYLGVCIYIVDMNTRIAYNNYKVCLSTGSGTNTEN